MNIKSQIKIEIAYRKTNVWDIEFITISHFVKNWCEESLLGTRCAHGGTESTVDGNNVGD